MKKLFLFILVVVMSFTLVACGEANNDENNAVMQAKIDELEALSQELISWYEVNGFLEGETASQFQPIVDNLSDSTEEIIALHKKQIDDGGYDDEDVERISIPLVEMIDKCKIAIEEQKAYDVSAVAGARIAVLKEKYNELVGIVNETSTTALANGWEDDEELNSELNAVFEFLEIVKSDLEIPDTMDEEYMNTIVVSIDEMISVWQEYLTIVSEPYVEN